MECIGLLHIDFGFNTMIICKKKQHKKKLEKESKEKIKKKHEKGRFTDERVKRKKRNDTLIPVISAIIRFN